MKQYTRRAAAVIAAGMLTLAGCGGMSNDSGGDAEPQESPSASAGSDEAGEETQSSSAAEGSDSSEGKDAKQSDSSAKDPAGTHIARTAGLTITVKDIERAAAKVRSTASSAGGYVSSEETQITGDSPQGSGGSTQSTTGPSRPGAWAEIVVTVPVDELDGTIEKLSEVGTVTERTSDAEDLTKQYTDTKARVRSMKSSIERLRKLISDTEDLDQVVTLEGELADREADLESMVSQQKSLEKRTTTAPITVSLVSPETAQTEENEEDDRGFVAGLKSGWSGFTEALTVSLTVLGAVTPFAVAILVVAGPLAWWLRRRRAGREPQTVAPEAG